MHCVTTMFFFYIYLVIFSCEISTKSINQPKIVIGKQLDQIKEEILFSSGEWINLKYQYTSFSISFDQHLHNETDTEGSISSQYVHSSHPLC